jgi:hypothetical protein
MFTMRVFASLKNENKKHSTKFIASDERLREVGVNNLCIFCHGKITDFFHSGFKRCITNKNKFSDRAKT